VALTPKYCAACGSPLTRRTPGIDQRERLACSHCDFVWYENPKILVCCIATWQERALWIKRATDPQHGMWAQPAGFMEKGETPEEAACRELYEETGAVLRPEQLKLFIVGSLPEISEVYLVYRGELERPRFATSSPEAEEVALYAESEVPWHSLAYPEVAEASVQFYRDHAAREYGVYSGCYVQGRHRLTRIALEAKARC
jgi:ADP-ribose pyrophosphatase YjhB (NUDIX family)